MDGDKSLIQLMLQHSIKTLIANPTAQNYSACQMTHNPNMNRIYFIQTTNETITRQNIWPIMPQNMCTETHWTPT